MKVQIFEQFMGGHYTNYIEHLLPTLIELKKSNLINEIIVTITSEHLKSEYFEKQLKDYSQWVNFDPCLQDFLEIIMPNLKPEVKTWESVLQD